MGTKHSIVDSSGPHADKFPGVRAYIYGASEVPHATHGIIELSFFDFRVQIFWNGSLPLYSLHQFPQEYSQSILRLHTI